MDRSKKYEEELGPIVSATLLVGAVTLIIHSIACVWFMAFLRHRA